MPATKQAARKPMKMTMRRPISAMPGQPTLSSLRERGHDPSVRHRHRAQSVAFAHRELFGLRLELAAGGEDVAAARGTYRRGKTGVEDVLGEFLDLVPVRAFIGRAG